MRDALVLVTTSYPRRGDGSEAAGSFVADLAEELSARIAVRVVAPGDKDAHEQITPRLSVYRFRAPRGNLVNLRLWNPLDALRIAAVLRAGARTAARAAADGRVCAVLACWILPSGWWARSLWRKHGIPYATWALGSDIWSLGRIPFVRGILRRVLRDAKFRFADGLLLGKDSQAIAGAPVEFLPSTRRPNAAPANSMPAERAPYRLVFIGRWHPNKGVDLLLDALSLLRPDDWALIKEVAIYGGGPMQSLVQQKVAALQALGRPMRLGAYLPKAQAEEAIARADYLVLPSRIESIPVIFSDAMKLGRPIIAMPTGDLPALHAQSAFGVMAARIDAAALADAIRAALRRSARDFASSARLHAAQFDLAAIAGKIIRDLCADA
jgi:glycosyltransferase involved in cell wall biosynthesis